MKSLLKLNGALRKIVSRSHKQSVTKGKSLEKEWVKRWKELKDETNSKVGQVQRYKLENGTSSEIQVRSQKLVEAKVNDSTSSKPHAASSKPSL